MFIVGKASVAPALLVLEDEGYSAIAASGKTADRERAMRVATRQEPGWNLLITR
jgi:hypothetical protein